MLPGERIRLHEAYGAALARDPGPGEEDAGRSAALAYHWHAALDLPRALPAAVDAARHAMASCAPAEDLRQLERALELWPRGADAAERNTRRRQLLEIREQRMRRGGGLHADITRPGLIQQAPVPRAA